MASLAACYMRVLAGQYQRSATCFDSSGRISKSVICRQWPYLTVYWNITATASVRLPETAGCSVVHLAWQEAFSAEDMQAAILRQLRDSLLQQADDLAVHLVSQQPMPRLSVVFSSFVSALHCGQKSHVWPIPVRNRRTEQLANQLQEAISRTAQAISGTQAELASLADALTLQEVEQQLSLLQLVSCTQHNQLQVI